MKLHLIALLGMFVLLGACRRGPVAPTATLPNPTPDFTLQPVPADTVTPQAPTAVIPSLTPPAASASQIITFQAEDGVTLTGEVYPAVGITGPAAGIMLMHQMGSNRKIWVEKGLVAWLTHRQTSLRGSGQAWFSTLFQAPIWPALPPGTAFTVFTFDFRGHGDSQGRVGDTADFLMDAKAAITTFQGLPGVDPQRIALIGASIGADAAADVCVEGCWGALSFSPGGYLDVPYAEVVGELAAEGKLAWCVASQGDSLPADTCQAASGETHRAQIYPGTAHGTDLLTPGLQPDIAQIVLDFLKITFGF